MSRIKQLSIKGIRNFDDDRESPTIKFSRPLTLILGPNGTGKTTIIECLKYILSGEFPPGSSSGKAFIHDPLLKRSATSTVRGNVKAEIIDCRGDRLTISRTIESTRILANEKFKTLDSCITRIDRKTGKKTQLTGTCAAMDREVMIAMGVSKAILNYVLFCHQDDADWAFDTGQKLKERFDEIFDTIRYNKAVDALRKIIKDQKNEQKVLVAEQRGLIVTVEEVKSKRRKLVDFETRRNETREKINDFTKKLRPINQRLEELKLIEEDYSRWIIEDERKKMEFKLANQQIASLRSEIKEFYEGTDAELQNEIDTYVEMLDEKNAQMLTLENLLSDIAEKDRKISKVISERRVTVGTLQQQMSDQTLRISKRNDNFREIIAAWEFSETIGPEFSESEASNLIKKMDKKMRQFEQEIESKRAEQDQEQERHQRKVNTLRAEKSTIESQLANNRRELQNIRGEIRTNSALLKQSGAMEEKLNDVDAKLERANKRVEDLNKSFANDNLKEKIQEATSQEEKDERKCNLIDREITALREQSTLQMKLGSSHAELLEKEKEIEILKKKHGDTLEMLLGKREFPEGMMMDTINEIQIVLTNRIQKLRKEIDGVQYEMMKLETSVKHKREELDKKRTEVRADQERVELLCGEYANYREVLSLNSKKVKDMEDERGMYAYQGSAYKDYIKKLSEPKSCCPLCHRGFKDSNESMNLVAELKSDMTDHPERLKNCEKLLSSQRKKYDALLQLQPIVEKIENFEEVEETKMRKDIDEASKTLAITRQKVKRLQESIAEPERQMSICKDMIGDMTLWDRCSNEISSLNMSINEFQDSLRDAGLKSDKTIQEAESEQNALQKKLKDARQEIKMLQSTLDSRNEEMRQATESRTKLLQEQLRIHKEMQEIKQAKENLDQLRTKEIGIVENVESFEKRLIEVGDECGIATKNLELAKKNIRAAQDFDRNKLRERGKEFDKLTSMQSEIDRFVSRKIGDELKTVEAKLDSAERYADKLRIERTSRESEMTKIRENILSHDTRKRDLADNLTLRRKEAEVKELGKECQNLKDKLAGINYSTVAKERKTLCERRDATDRERNIAQGNIEELERNVEQLTLELERSEYRTARAKYTDKCAELAISLQGVKDLQQYCKALDNGMIAYHEERMSTVNKSMKKLWELIYQGGDTTSIQIRTEANTNSADKKRQFNYKLVQKKHGVEMDMKGRCSAGQKVLASIILRLALAETFCEKCGVLALDEPTTNLDEENSRSLADALHGYVNRRARFQKNFQLIIITHDDNFTPKLGQLSKTNSYYQLFRYDSGLSGIRLKSFEDYPGMPSCPTNDSSDDEIDGSSSNAPRSNDSKRPRKKHVFE